MTSQSCEASLVWHNWFGTILFKVYSNLRDHCQPTVGSDQITCQMAMGHCWREGFSRSQNAANTGTSHGILQTRSGDPCHHRRLTSIWTAAAVQVYHQTHPWQRKAVRDELWIMRQPLMKHSFHSRKVVESDHLTCSWGPEIAFLTKTDAGNVMKWLVWRACFALMVCLKPSEVMVHENLKDSLSICRLITRRASCIGLKVMVK